MWQPTHVKVTIKQAKGLLCKGRNGTNDAFVVIGIGKEKYQTSVKEKATAELVDWREECELEIPSHGNTAGIQLTVYHHNSIGMDEFLGQVHLPLNDFDVYEKPKYRYYRLRGKPDKDKKKGEKDRGELEAMVNFIVKSGSFLDVSKKEKQKSTTSLKNLGGSLLSLGSKDNQSLKKFAKSVSSKMDKITKPKRKKSKSKKENAGGTFSNELMASQQYYGDADPGVISDEEDDEFRFDEDVKVYTRSESPRSSTLSRNSSFMQDQILDDDVASYASQESGQAFYGGKAPGKPPRIIDQIDEKESLEIESPFVDPSPVKSRFPDGTMTTSSPTVKVNVIPSSPEYYEAEAPRFESQRSQDSVVPSKRKDLVLESVAESVIEPPMHTSFHSINDASSKSSSEFYSPVELSSSKSSDGEVNRFKEGSTKGRRSRILKMNSISFNDESGPDIRGVGVGDDRATNHYDDDTYSIDSAHTRSASDGSSQFSSNVRSSDNVRGSSMTNEYPYAYADLNQVDSGSFSSHLEAHRSSRDASKKISRVSTAGSIASNGSDGVIVETGSETKEKSIIRSGSLSEKRTSDSLVDEWERKLYGKSGITGSNESVSITGSRSSLNTSRSSSTQDLRRDDAFTRFPEVKAITLERKLEEGVDGVEVKKPKKKVINAFKTRFFSKGGGSHERLNEEDSRIVEGGNDRVSTPPSRTSKLPQEVHEKFSGKSREDLMEMILNLQGVVQRQARHGNDLEEYIDNLLLRVMDATPHILQMPITFGNSIKNM